jgi:hypothetical protein
MWREQYDKRRTKRNIKNVQCRNQLKVGEIENCIVQKSFKRLIEIQKENGWKEGEEDKNTDCQSQALKIIRRNEQRIKN